MSKPPNKLPAKARPARAAPIRDVTKPTLVPPSAPADVLGMFGADQAVGPADRPSDAAEPPAITDDGAGPDRGLAPGATADAADDLEVVPKIANNKADEPIADGASDHELDAAELTPVQGGDTPPPDDAEASSASLPPSRATSSGHAGPETGTPEHVDDGSATPTDVGQMRTSSGAPITGEEQQEDASTTGIAPRFLPAHPAANLFPMLSEVALRSLATDIEANGLQEAIVMHDGLVLDGRNRLAACKIAGVEPRFVEWVRTGSPTAWVLGRNLHRRHLTASERAAVALDALPLLEAEARERQRAAATRTNTAKQDAGEEAAEASTLPEFVPEAALSPEDRVSPLHEIVEEAAEVHGPTREVNRTSGEAREQAASLAGVNPRYVSDLKAAAAVEPSVVDAVRQGKVTVPEAKRIAALPSAPERKAAIAAASTPKPKPPAKKATKDAAAQPAEAPPRWLPAIRKAAGPLTQQLDAIPEDDRPPWWTPLRKALRFVLGA